MDRRKPSSLPSGTSSIGPSFVVSLCLQDVDPGARQLFTYSEVRARERTRTHQERAQERVFSRLISRAFFCGDVWSSGMEESLRSVVLGFLYIMD